MKQIQRIALLVVLLAGLGAAGAFAWLYVVPQSNDLGPTAKVRRSDFPVVVRCRGELKARRSVQVTAPINVPELRIVWLAPTGSQVKQGDPIIRFDPSSVRQQLKEKQAALKQAEASLVQAKAEGGITAEQDKRDLKEAQYQVERAKLEVSKQEIVSKLQGETSAIDLQMAGKKLEVQQAKVDLNAASAMARVASLERQRQKAADEVELTELRLSKMEIRAPINGMVTYMSNFSQGWMNAKPFKVGDQVWPGSVIAEVPDLASLEMEGKIEEIDRGRMSPGLETAVRVDALPEKTFKAALHQLSPLTEVGWEWPPSRSFKGWARIDGDAAQLDPRLRPGMNGRMDVVLSRIPKALSLPSTAIFTRNGKPVVYVARKGVAQPVEIEILARNPDEVAITGVPENAEVALTEPRAGKKGEESAKEAKR